MVLLIVLAPLFLLRLCLLPRLRLLRPGRLFLLPRRLRLLLRPSILFLPLVQRRMHVVVFLSGLLRRRVAILPLLLLLLLLLHLLLLLALLKLLLLRPCF